MILNVDFEMADQDAAPAQLVQAVFHQAPSQTVTPGLGHDGDAQELTFVEHLTKQDITLGLHFLRRPMASEPTAGRVGVELAG